MTIPTIDLASPGGAVPIPALGFGVWQVADDEAERAVAEALRVGYRHVDTAKLYHNEVGTGRAVRDSGLAREDVFVTTKVWPTDFGAEATPAAFEASMDRLGLDVLDLLLLHWPWPHEDRYIEAYAALLALRATGRVRAVGVSNFAIPHLERVHAELGEYPAINQIELHPYLQQRELRAFHREHGIVTEAWSPLASGQRVLTDPVVAQVAAKHSATPAQAILAWHLAIGNVVIPKSVTPSRIAENFRAAELTLDSADIEAFEALDQGFRTGPDPEAFEG